MYFLIAREESLNGFVSLFKPSKVKDSNVIELWWVALKISIHDEKSIWLCTSKESLKSFKSCNIPIKHIGLQSLEIPVFADHKNTVAKQNNAYAWLPSFAH